MFLTLFNLCVTLICFQSRLLQIYCIDIFHFFLEPSAENLLYMGLGLRQVIGQKSDFDTFLYPLHVQQQDTKYYQHWVWHILIIQRI